VTSAAYRDFERRPDGIRNESQVADHSRALAERVAAGIADERFLVVLGGDCSIILGSLLGATHGGARRVGLAYFDAHADFATPQESLTGSAASMCLALAVGRGDSPLARLAGTGPLVRAEDATVIGRRDIGQDRYGDTALRASGVLDLSDAFAAGNAAEAAVAAALGRIARAELAGFWIHIDADVLEPSVMRRSIRPSRAVRTSSSSPRWCASSLAIRARSACRSRSTIPRSIPAATAHGGSSRSSHRASTERITER
jgi:arginase